MQNPTPQAFRTIRPLTEALLGKQNSENHQWNRLRTGTVQKKTKPNRIIPIRSRKKETARNRTGCLLLNIDI